MGQKSGPVKEPAEQVVKEIRRATRRQFSAEEKIRIVLTGLRGEDSIAELCRREGIVENLYFVPAYTLPVYASQWPLPDTTQDSVHGCWLGFAAVAIAGD